MDKRQYIAQLYEKYLQDQYSTEELKELMDLMNVDEHRDYVIQILEDSLQRKPTADINLVNSIDKKVSQQIFGLTRRNRKLRKLQYLKYAGILLLFFSISIVLFTYMQNRTDQGEMYLSHTEKIIWPGTNRATITLDDGRRMDLNETQLGIIQSANGINYMNGKAIKGLKKSRLITLSTPRAGQYFITLQDSTKVWLNAMSEIVFPSSFDGSERKVEVKGEVYFDVAHDANKPFVVQTEQQEIYVLGTQFNVKAYEDELYQTTTLVEGKVTVKSPESQEKIWLSPSTQAVSQRGQKPKVLNVDPMEYTSWKDGVIVLNNYDLSEIIKQLERWYDVDFGGVPVDVGAERVFGMIDRDVPLNDVLETLMDNYKNISFEIEGRRVLMSKK